ncbi:MAG: response regulator transcription factor [Nitrospirae bacterium]|nr:response regulator transcription factor [Nitrospirota bacterium]
MLLIINRGNGKKIWFGINIKGDRKAEEGDERMRKSSLSPFPEMKSILLVEDDVEIRESTKLILESKYHVLDASNYSEATTKLKSHIDLAIIDYILPDYDGFELLKELRKVKPTLPVIMMTGYGTEAIAIKAFRSGVTDYIKKPITPVYLMKRLSEILEGDAFIEEVKECDIKDREDFILSSIAIHIRENYMKAFTLGRLAVMAGMSRFKFCRTFKEKFGISYTSYLNDVRIKNASALLNNPDISITEIAHNVGYSCVTYFERVFKSRYRISPMEYRMGRLNKF